MELKEEINSVRELLKQIADDAWVSYRGSYSFYNYFVNAKFERLDYIEERMDTLTPEEVESYLREVTNLHTVLGDYKGKALKDKIVSEISKKEEVQEEKQESIEETQENDKDMMNFSDEEIQNLLGTLEDNKLENVYPSQDFDEEFIPLDLPDIPGDNPIQPGDIEKSVNLPR